MNDTIMFMIFLQILLIFLNAVFACAEIAVISMNDNLLKKMAKEGNKKADRLVKLTSEPARFLSTIQIAITLSGFLGSAFAAENFSDILVNWILGMGVTVDPGLLNTIAVVVITIILSYFTLVFGEIVPKQVAMRKAKPLALGMSGMLSGISKIFSPIVSLLTVSTNGVLRLMGIDPNAEENNASEEEIRMLVDVGSEKGIIDQEEKEFIQNVFEFDDIEAEKIMTHRKDAAMLDLEDTMEQWDEIIFSSRHTLYPVYNGNFDDIVGILNAKDYFRLEKRDRESVMKNAVNPAYFVNESIKADVLFKKMKNDRQMMAVVVDEYGGTNGIVTINDLVEQLVGKIQI